MMPGNVGNSAMADILYVSHNRWSREIGYRNVSLDMGLFGGDIPDA